jgi:hypothetical protein
MDNLARVISDLQDENRRLEGELKRVQGALTVLRGLNTGSAGRTGTTVKTRRKLSASARKRIADAQRARWAKWKAKKAA